MNEILVDKGRRACSCKEFFAYIGLELGMSLLKFNDIKKKNWAWGSFVHVFIFYLDSHMTVMEPVVIFCGFADH
jgi:hypothetical protein